MRLRSKLLLLQLPLALAIVLLAALAVAMVNQLDDQAQSILRRNYAHKNAIHHLELELARLGAATDTQAERVPLDKATYDVLVENVELHVREPLDAEERPKAEALRAAFAAYSPLYEHFARTTDAAARKALLPSLQASWAAVTSAAESLWQHHDANMMARGEAQARLAGRLRALTLAAALAALVLGVVLATLAARRLARPITALAGAARRVAEKDFGARVEVRGDDEVARLARDFSRMAAELARFEALSVDELVRAKHALQAAIDSLVDPVLVFDGDHDTLALGNQAAHALLGLDGGADLAPLEDRPRLRDLVRALRQGVLRGDGPHVPRSFDEAVPVESERGELWYLGRAMPIVADGARVVGASVMLQDVTRFRRIDELRNDMVSTVAHELKTPLTSLQMSIGLCADQVAGPVTAKQAQLLRTAREDTQRLYGMVAELLDLARLQAGRMVLDQMAQDPAALLAEAVAPHAAAAESKGVTLTVEPAANLPSLVCDPERVKIVFANLVTNAIRYTPTGGSVTVRARAEGAEAIAFEVADSGKGIPAELRPRVFDKFFRVPGSPKGGAGLGLWITREIVEAHGGRITVGANEPAGTVFRFTLPLQPPARAAA